MGKLNNIVDKTWNRQKFIDKQRRRRKYRFFIRIKNRIILYWLNFKDIYSSWKPFEYVELNGIIARRNKLTGIEERGLEEFLRDFDKSFDLAEKKLSTIDFKRILPKSERCLSPSDFGFHNAICDVNGVYHFVDFEYFGWDDPAKMICDFILHPGMDLPNKYKKTLFFP